MDRRELLGKWLRDAHGMEQALIPVLENHAVDAEQHPEIQDRIEEHIAETRRHVDVLEECLRSIGEETSTPESMTSPIAGNFQDVSTGMAHDELIKNAITDFSAEQFEIASYKALIEAAEQLGDTEMVQMLQQNLQDEERMAQWLDDELPTVVRSSIAELADPEMAESFYEQVDEDSIDDSTEDMDE